MKINIKLFKKFASFPLWKKIIYVVLILWLIKLVIFSLLTRTTFSIETDHNLIYRTFGQEPAAHWTRSGPGILKFHGTWKGDGESTKQLKALLNEPIDTIRIDYSSGGETSEAIANAELLIPFKPRIVVNGYCASSCANYLLPIGREIQVRRAAIIAYHGNICEVLSGYESCKIEEDFWKKLPQGDLKKAITAGIRKINMPRNAGAWMPTQADFIKAGYPPVYYDWYPEPYTMVSSGIYCAPSN